LQIRFCLWAGRTNFQVSTDRNDSFSRNFQKTISDIAVHSMRLFGVLACNNLPISLLLLSPFTYYAVNYHPSSNSETILARLLSVH
jgi:hypothetical protein